LSLLQAIYGCWLHVAEGDLFTFDNGPPCPEHNRGAVKDVVQVGVATVVHQTAGQEQTRAQFENWRDFSFRIVVGVEALHGKAVELNNQ